MEQEKSLWSADRKELVERAQALEQREICCRLREERYGTGATSSSSSSKASASTALESNPLSDNKETLIVKKIELDEDEKRLS